MSLAEQVRALVEQNRRLEMRVAQIEAARGGSIGVRPSSTDTVVDVLTLARASSGTAANGIGAGLAFALQDASGNKDEAASIDAVLTTAAHATQAAELRINVLGSLWFALNSLGNLALSKIRFTPEGGIAVLLTAGADLYAGEVVAVGGGDDMVEQAPLNSDMPIGVVYADAITDNSVWVVVAGICDVLPIAAAHLHRGEVIYCSGTTAGRVDSAATLPAVAAHNREIGHVIEDSGGSNGAACRCVIHWN